MSIRRLNGVKAIKYEYLHPSLQLYAPNGNIIKILNGNSVKCAYDIVKTSTKNDVSKLSFKVAYRSANQLLNYNSCEMTLKFGSKEWYIIKNIKLTDENKREIEVTAQSSFVSLKGIKCQCLNLIGQDVKSLFNNIMASPKNVNLVEKYKFKGTDISGLYRAIQTENEVSVFENLLTLCKKFNAFMEFSFTETGQKEIFIRKNPIFNGKYIRKGKGLKSLNIEMDTNDICTRMYGYGASDLVTGNPITFMSINNEPNTQNKAYIEDVSFFKAMGMTDIQIYNNEQCLQENDYTDNNITTPEELLRLTKEELAKVCVPKITGTISMSDFSVYEDSCLTEPSTSEEIMFIDADIDFRIKCWVESIERKYSENPFDIAITISNVTNYDSIIKNLQRSADAVSTVTNINGTSGNPYVPASNVQMIDPSTGSYINVQYGTDQMHTKIIENEKEISLTAEDLSKSKAAIKITTDAITEDVTNLADDTATHFKMTDKQISAVVESPDGGSSWEMKKDSVTTAIRDATGNHTCVFDDDGLTVENGGFQIKNSSGSTVLWMGDDGNTEVTDIRIADVDECEGFKSSLANMSLYIKKVSTDEFVCNSDNFYINNGYNLAEFIKKVMDDEGVAYK